jgi:HlyD family secretion protein
MRSLSEKLAPQVSFAKASRLTLTSSSFCSSIALLLLLVLLALAGCAQVRDLSGAIGMGPGAEPGSALRASGTLRASELRLGSELGGRIATVAVRQGDRVRRGDLLVVLDATQWELALLPAEAALNVAVAELALLEAGPRNAEVLAGQAGVALAQARLDGALDAWQRARAQVASPQELDGQIVEARARVAQAEQAAELAEAQLQPAQIQRDIRAEGSTEREGADYQLRAAEHALAEAQADLATAEAVLNQLWAIRRQPLGYIAQANAAEGRVAMAEAEVAVAQARLMDLIAGPTDEELAVARAAIRQAEAEVDLLRLKIACAELYSSGDGVVLTQVLQAGELAAPAAPILVLVDLSEVRLKVFIPAAEMAQVRVGQEALVHVSSLPGHTFMGRVAWIGDEPEYTPRNIATVEERLNTFYAVELEIANPDGTLKPGMPAEAEFRSD